MLTFDFQLVFDIKHDAFAWRRGEFERMERCQMYWDV